MVIASLLSAISAHETLYSQIAGETYIGWSANNTTGKELSAKPLMRIL